MIAIHSKVNNICTISLKIVPKPVRAPRISTIIFPLNLMQLSQHKNHKMRHSKINNNLSNVMILLLLLQIIKVHIIIVNNYLVNVIL